MARESPWGFPPALFAAPDEARDTPSRRRALEVLPERGAVLDVGVGAGAASLALVPPAARLIGLDESATMLEAFAAAADARRVRHEEVCGRWPDVAPSAPVADVVVCHHVFYNVARLAPFALALGNHTDRRVVAELTAVHPQTSLNPLWRRFHGLERPTGPRAEDAVAVLAEAGIDAQLERFRRPPRWSGRDRAQIVAFVRRQLCLPVEREAELDDALSAEPAIAPDEAVTLWWDVRP